MSSLRTRQVISALSIIIFGLTVLGGLFYWTTQHRNIETEKAKLSESALELLGFLDFEDGKFIIDKRLKNDFLAFLVKHNFTKLSAEKYAYIQHIDSNNIVWHSQYPFNDISADRFAKDKERVFTTFNLKMPPNQEGVDIISPIDTQGRNKSKLDGAENYIVYA
ncbi:MAG: hypothetical protein ACWA5Q_05150, partial [bacterium]